MALPKRVYYTLDEVAARWNRTEDELLQWGGSGSLKLAFWCTDRNVWPYESGGWLGEIRVFINGAFFYISPFDIIDITRKGSTWVEFARAVNPSEFLDGAFDSVTLWLNNYKRPMNKPDDPIGDTPRYPVLAKDDLIIMAEEVDCMEAAFPELINFHECSKPEKEKTRDQEIVATQGNLLIGWKAIAEYMDCHPNTAKRRAKGKKWLRYSPEGKPTAMSADIDRIMTSGKKKI